MGVALCPSARPVGRHVRFEASTSVESRRPRPAFKNLGRGVF
jgi:hypothetical protein